MMTPWLESTLGEVCVKITDGAHHSPKSVEDGFPMASVKDLTGHGINLSSCRRISESDFRALVRQGCMPEPGDILIAKDGATALDTVCEMKKSVDVVMLSSVAILRPDRDRIDSSFLRYYLDSEETRAYMKNSFTSGAAIPRVILKDFKRTRVILPPLPTQRKIAGILSAYDDLIENNLRRIKILEDMAQSLYREWFVHFRFPGHESAQFVDTGLGRIPGEWQTSSIEEVCDRVTDGSHSSPASVEEGMPMASSKDMHTFGLNLKTSRTISAEDYEKLVRNGCQPKKNDILITKDGANYLKYILVVEKDLDVVLLSSIAILSPNSKVNPHFFAAVLNVAENKERLKNYVTGAAIPRIILKDFKRFQFVLPPLKIQEAWAKIGEISTQLCWDLVSKNQNLRETRDLLLSKLLSGNARSSP